MSDKSSIEIRPATDEELKIWQTRPCGNTQCRCTELHLDHAIARIDSDRATIAGLLAACEDLSERLTYVLEADEHGPDLCDADEGFLTRRCENDGCLLHAVKNAAFAITKAKESR